MTAAHIEFGEIPSCVRVKLDTAFIYIDRDVVDRFQVLVDAAPIGPETYENKSPPSDINFGITQSWLENAKRVWLEEYDWRRHEARLNTFPNFKTKVGDMEIFFSALFSTRPDAIPVLLLHGWPGSVMEFLPMLELIIDRYNSSTLPIHLIVPALPGYPFSNKPPLDKDFGLHDAASLMDGLMRTLGFDAYIAHGGDVGSMIAMILSATYDSCRALHVTYLAPNPSELPTDEEELSARETQHLARARAWRASGMGYALEQSTRPATIGLALSSSPLALLAWIGEKFVEWSDETPPLEEILGITTSYWLTRTYPSTLWSYRSIAKEGVQGLPTSREKPLGYSLFPRELGVVPRPWAEKLYPNLISYVVHEKGSHFPGLEQPEALLQDILSFVEKVSPNFESYFGSRGILNGTH
ncbi:putative hydrolases or acyltransferase [Mariannaea sp. PMI_226]|nr:putative hydrolases or acyltransferase [Mariannaea sp. PMI_226]